MAIAASDSNEGDVLSFVPAFQGVHGILADIHVYIFDEHGKLVDRQPVRRGRALVSLGSTVRLTAHVAVGPHVDERVHGPVTLEKMRAFHAFEAACQFRPDVTVHFLPEVPESVWRWWLVHSLWGTLKTRSDQRTAATRY